MARLNKYSSVLTGSDRSGGAQAMLMATGLTQSDLQKPQIGVCSVWYEGNPCNMHLNGLALQVKTGVESSGLVGFRFNTVGVSDGISMGTTGMQYSLQSREIIADSIETVLQAQFYDGAVMIPGCDKNLPGCLMAAARVDRPTVIVFGGSIAPGCHQGKPVDIVSAFQSYGEMLAGRMTKGERKTLLQLACPGPGACGGMYTANSMAVAIETLGLALPYSSSNPAASKEKAEECANAGEIMLRLLQEDLRPSKILTRKAFENAIAAVVAFGGSTNVVLHLLAAAHAARVDLTLRDIRAISARTPLIADLKPSGRFLMADLHRVGGTPKVLRTLLDGKLLHPDCLTVTGKTLAENLADVTALDVGQEVIRNLSAPLRSRGHLEVLFGNLAPGGAVAKITGKEGERFEGKAIVFDSEQAMLDGLEAGNIRAGHVVVIRYQGPKGGPGMPEMLSPTSAIVGSGLRSKVALITDGRFSGGSHGFIVGHISPEAQSGGPIALIQDGDTICIDAMSRSIELRISPDELQERQQSWTPPPIKTTRGTLGKYIRLVGPAEFGCVTDG